MALALLVAGCGNTNNAPDPMTFSQINSQVFTISCALSDSCHKSAVKAQGNLDLKTDPYNALINVPVYNAKAQAEGKKRVVPGDSANSFLYQKLTLPPSTIAGQQTCPSEMVTITDGGLVTGPAPGDYGSCMPQTSTPLDPVTIAAIKRWIDSGAPNN
jgi:hypothetical protein